MSGIFGIYYSDKRPVNPDDLDRMRQRLAHRGPDGSHVWLDGHVGLGACLAHTTPQSVSEPLPLRHPAGLALTGDLRLDNRDDLLAALSLPGTGPDMPGDGELVLLAYLRWGDDCLARLVGDFAFVLWDGRAHRLLVARDAFGVRPFYYLTSENAFVFASEIKALFALPFTPRRLNEARLAHYLIQSPGDSATTLYQDIMRLPPGHALSIGLSGMRIWQYWSLDPHKEVHFRTDAEYPAAFRQIFSAAVKSRVCTDAPLGVALSGGLDSSSIAQVTSQCFLQAGKPPVPAFSAVFPEMPEPARRQLDERPFIQVVLQAGRYQPFEVRADRLSPWAEQERLFTHQDQVYFAPTLSIYWALYQAVSQQGIRVYLEGIDGDLTVSHGFERLPELFLSGRWNRLAGEARALSTNGVLSKSTREIIWQYGIRPVLPQRLVALKRSIQRNQPPAELAISLLRPEFARRSGISKHTLDELQNGSGWRRGARYVHWLSLTSAHVSLALEMLDHVSTGLGLELRYPFFDRRLVEFCLALPAEQKLSQGITRRVQRMAMVGLLPEAVVWRNWKADFLVYFLDSLLRYEQSRVEDVVYKNNRSIQPYINLATLRSAWETYKKDPSGSLLEASMVYAAVQLGAWLDLARL